MCFSSELAAVIGTKEMIKLQRALEGWHYIAERPGPNNKIAQVLGAKKARQLGKHFATERVWIGKGYLKADRNNRIRDAHKHGVSTKDLGKRFSMTPRNIRIIVST